jgi:Zn-dependent protease
VTNLYSLPLLLIPAILAVTVHEIAHGWVALQLGDSTAADARRLSLNPLRHVDPIGTVLVPITLYLIGEFVFGSRFFFGWARPVPVRWECLTPRRAGIAAVAAAGPGANLLMLGAWAFIGLTVKHSAAPSAALIYMCEAGIIFNAAIMIINLIPIPPLDGSRMVTALLPPVWARRYNRLEAFGLLIIVGLLLSGALQQIVGPLLGGIVSLIGALGL